MWSCEESSKSRLSLTVEDPSLIPVMLTFVRMTTQDDKVQAGQPSYGLTQLPPKGILTFVLRQTKGVGLESQWKILYFNNSKTCKLFFEFFYGPLAHGEPKSGGKILVNSKT